MQIQLTNQPRSQPPSTRTTSSSRARSGRRVVLTPIALGPVGTCGRVFPFAPRLVSTVKPCRAMCVGEVGLKFASKEPGEVSRTRIVRPLARESLPASPSVAQCYPVRPRRSSSGARKDRERRASPLRRLATAGLEAAYFLLPLNQARILAMKFPTQRPYAWVHPRNNHRPFSDSTESAGKGVLLSDWPCGQGSG